MVRHCLLGLDEAHDFMDVLLFSYTCMTNQWLNDQSLVCAKELCKHLLPGYSPVTSVNRLVRLPAAGRDPHAGWCGSWGAKTPGYPISAIFIFL